MFCSCSYYIRFFVGLKKRKTRDWLAIAGLLKVFWLNQKFVPTMPGWQTTRVQMDRCPLDCASRSMVANVVFMFDSRIKYHLRAFVKKFRAASA
jgi:hypothetical protein